MSRLAIYGAGGFGKEVACLLNKINECNPTWDLIGFYDRIYDKGYDNGYGLVHGSIEELNNLDEEIALVIAVGDTSVVRFVVESIHNKNIYYPNIIHPSFYMADSKRFSIGRGNIIQRDCSVSCDVEIGSFNVINSSVSIGHDVKVGNYNSFMPGVRVSGEVHIADFNFFGVGSIILQQINIGNKVRLGAGSILMTKPKDNKLYMGNPARKTEF